MESIFLDKREILLDALQQIRDAIVNLLEWNKGISDMNNLLKSPSGMQDLAGNCMVIMAIGEGFKKVDKMTTRKTAGNASRNTMASSFWIEKPYCPWVFRC